MELAYQLQRKQKNKRKRRNTNNERVVEMDSDDFVPFSHKEHSSDSTEESSSSYTMPALITDVRAPWMEYSQSNDEECSSSSLVRLHNEILTFCEYVAPTKVLHRCFSFSLTASTGSYSTNRL